MCCCHCLVTQFCLTLCDFTDCNLPGSSVHGIFQAGILEWVAISFSRGIFPTQGWNSHFLSFLPWQAGSLPRSHLGGPWIVWPALIWPVMKDFYETDLGTVTHGQRGQRAMCWLPDDDCFKTSPTSGYSYLETK